MSVSPCPGCLSNVYRLRNPATDEVLNLDPVDHPLGIWAPEPDGRTCRKLTTADVLAGRHGHQAHQCPAPAEQPTLFDVAGQA